MNSLFLVDASGYLFRAYHAIQAMSSGRGEATNALFGFIRSIMNLKEQFPEGSVISIFDGRRSKELRLKLYPEYKAHRKTTPEDLIQQIEQAQHFCALMGIPIIVEDGVEADDSIASVVQWAKRNNIDKVSIVSSDKDLAQLVDETTVLINPHKGNAVIDAAKVEEQFGVPPKQIGDYLSLLGDTSDNIPGIEGIGPKGASQLLSKYGSLENILAHAHEIPGKKGETLQKSREIALLSQQLVRLKSDVPIPDDIAFYEGTPPQWNELLQFFREKNFTSLLKLIPNTAQLSETNAIKSSYHLINDLDAFKDLIEKLSSQKEICFDTETTDIRPLYACIVGIGFCFSEDNIYYVPFNGALERDLLIKHLKPLFENEQIGFFAHNAKYDRHVLYNEGIFLKTVSFDTMVASYILNAHQRRHSLDDLSLEYFGKKKISIDSLIGTGKKQISMTEVPIEKVCEYCCEDVEYTFRLKKVLEQQLIERNLLSLYKDIELPLLPILGDMERRGIYVDVDFLKVLSRELAVEIKKLEETIYLLADGPFNINSPKQLSEILFEKLQLPVQKRGRTMPTTNADALETLAYNYPIAEKILEYRSLEKLRSTYVDSLPEDINPETHRIHCQFNQSVTATGRLSCQDPNLQNIPIRTEIGKKIRQAFLPESKNASFISGDYSQIELRILAHLTEDPGLITAFHNNVDVHSFTAAEIFHIPFNEVTSDMRRRAKAVNFGVIYGQQAFGLSQQLRIPIHEAATFIDLYFKRYPKIKEYIEEAKASARATGKTFTLTGRERLLPDINSSNQILRSAAERLAVNTPLQGTAADLIKIAMIQIDAWLKNQKSKSMMILQIHDELLFEVPDEELSEVKRAVKQHMEQVITLKVPLLVEIEVGKNWKNCYD